MACKATYSTGSHSDNTFADNLPCNTLCNHKGQHSERAWKLHRTKAPCLLVKLIFERLIPSLAAFPL